jgi:hypothetical protein
MRGRYHARVPNPRFGEWQAFGVDELCARFGAQRSPWWVAGGRALELFAGRSWRAHGDSDVGVLRVNQKRVLAALDDLEAHAAAGGELTPLPAGERAPEHANSIWLRERGGPWRCEILLESCDGEAWVFRREPALRLPLSELVWRSPQGVPHLRPDVQLLYKAKSVRPKDELDFAAVAPLLDTDSCQWLRAALARVHPDHPWLARAELRR